MSSIKDEFLLDPINLIIFSLDRLFKQGFTFFLNRVVWFLLRDTVHPRRLLLTTAINQLVIHISHAQLNLLIVTINVIIHHSLNRHVP